VVAASSRTSALTDNFIPVELAASLPANQLVRIQITAIAPDNTLLASPILTTASQVNPPSRFYPEPSKPILESAF
jgi:hypothetical protein